MATTNNSDIKKLLETFDRTEQWRSDDPNPPGHNKLVGETDKFLGEPYIREEETDEAKAQPKETIKRFSDHDKWLTACKRNKYEIGSWGFGSNSAHNINGKVVGEFKHYNDCNNFESPNGWLKIGGGLGEAFDLQGLMTASDAAKKHAGQAVIPKGSSGDVMHRRENEKLLAHYIRKAHSNGLKGAEAVKWAHRAMHSETQRVFDDKAPQQVDERGVGAGIGDATQRGTPPWMMPGGGNDDDNFGGKKTSFKLSSDSDDDIEVNPFADVDEAADTFNPETDADTGTHVRMAKQPTSVFQKPGLSAAARKMAADRELKKMRSQNPFDQDDLDFTAPATNSQPVFNSKDYDDVSVLEAKLMKAYEDYVGDPYSENNVIPKQAKKPGKDAPKPKKAKRVPEPNELAETSDNESRAKYQEFMKKHSEEGNYPNLTYGEWVIKQKPKMKEVKPFKDAAATGNPRDFANESTEKITELAKWRKEGGKGGATGLGKTFTKRTVDYGDREIKEPIGRQGLDKDSNPIDDGSDQLAGRDKAKTSVSGKPLLPRNAQRNLKGMIQQSKGQHGPKGKLPEAKGPSKEQAKKNAAEWSKIEAHWKKLHGNDVQMPSGAAGEQRMRQAWNKKNHKKTNEAKGQSENRELWDRIKSRGTTRGIDQERYTDMSGEGLEGPFSMKNGKVLYYDPKEGNYYDRDTDMYVSYDDYQAMNEADPSIPYETHLRDKEKDRKAFAANFKRGEGDRLRKASDAAVARFMQQANTFTNPTHAAMGESGRGAKLAALRAKFEDVSCKLKELKGQKALKEAPIDQTVAQPINTAQSPAQQAPVQAPAGTPTATAAPGQPAPPAAGQPGGAPVQAPGTPAPPGPGATNAATTPGEQMKGFVQALSNNPAGAKQLATKLNTVR